MRGLKVLHLVKSKGRECLELKKQWLLMVKVLQESEKESGVSELQYEKQKKVVQGYITALSTAVKAISPHAQGVPEIIESLKPQSHLTTRGVQTLQKYQEIVGKVEKTL